MAAAKAARRNTTVYMHDFYLPNDPFQDPCIGRRTGVPLNIEARKDSDGFDNIDDYFPDSDPEEENIVPNVQSADKDLLAGRRSGIKLDINPDSGKEKSKESAPAKGEASNPTSHDDQAEDLSEKGSENTHEDPEELDAADTPGRCEESPNDTGTIIKNPTSREPTPQFRGPIKKRLSFSHEKSLTEPGLNKETLHPRIPPDNKDGEVIIEEDGDESVSELDVVAVDDDSQAEHHEASNKHPSTAIRTKEKARKQTATNTKQKKIQSKEAEEEASFIDVEEIEGEDTFLTIGNTTHHAKSIAGDKYTMSAKAQSFVMSESFVLEGTKHKTMSPEYGSCSDSQPEPRDLPAPRGKKSKIPVRKKGVATGAKQRSTRGRQKKVQELQDVEREVENDKDGRDKGLQISKQEQSKSTRRQVQKMKQRSTRARSKKMEEPQNVEVEEGEDIYIESDKDDVEVDVISSDSKPEQSKPSRGRKHNTDKEGNIDNEQEAKVSRGRKSVPNTRQEQKKVPRGRKQKSDENIEYEVKKGDDEHEDFDGGKSGGPKTTTKKQKHRERVTDGRHKTGEAEGEVEDRAELSGRKTRAQRKTEADAKLDRKDDRGEERADDIEVVVDDSDTDAVEVEKVVEGEKAELSGRKTRAQRKKEADAKVSRKDGNEGVEADIEVDVANSEAGDAVDAASEDTDEAVQNNRAQKLDAAVYKKGRARKAKDKSELENEGNLDEIPSKNRGKKSVREETEGQDLAEDMEHVPKARRGGKGKGEKTLEIQDEGQRDDLDAVPELDAEHTSSNKTVQESISNSSSVSSNASSGSESKKKAGTNRRKRISVLPPYKRKANKANTSKASLSVSRHDSTTESGQRTDAKKPRLDEDRNQSNSAHKTSKKRGVTGSSVAQVGNRSARGKISTTQRNKTKESEDGDGKSSSDDDDAAADVDEVDDEGDGNYSVQEAGGVEDRSFEEVPSENATPAASPRAAKPATALKSILKSGGSVGQATVASRKRQMKADKSHSGGSDADDESVLPAKQPNRKRLSTVSFASTNFVCASPEDLTPSMASRGSPLCGLSFVSKDSSYRSADGTFTPGSGRMLRSSVGSASGFSSAGESVIDPEEEVTITNNTKQLQDSIDEQSTRRSKRTIVPPLQFWKNERIDYERRKSGGWCIKGVIKNPTPTPKPRRKSKQPKKPAARKQSHSIVNAIETSEEELDNEVLEGFQEIPNPKGIVINPENNQGVEMDLFHAPGMLNFTNPSGQPVQDDDPLIVHKFISQPLFGGGQVILRPGAEKGRQFVRNDTMVFYVIKGRIMVTVHQSSVVLHTGSTFFVPQGNSYNIKNLKQTDAKLMFVQIKG